MSAYTPVRFIPTDTDLICFGEMGLRRQVQCLGRGSLRAPGLASAEQ